MKLKISIVLFFVMTAFAVQAQKSKLVIGKWQYKDIGEKEKLDSVALKTLPAFFGDMKIEFKKDGKYTASVMGKTDEGTWTLDKKETQILLTPSKGKPNSLQLVNVTDKELSIRFGTSGKGYIIMERTEASSTK